MHRRPVFLLHFLLHQSPHTLNTSSMKPSPVLSIAVRRMRLTTKQGPKGYYKGTRTGSMGTHTKFGKYLIDYNKVRTYVMPDLTGFEVGHIIDARRLMLTLDS